MTAEPARQFSGRRLQRDEDSCASFVFDTYTRRMYSIEDSGSDHPFKKIDVTYESLDLAILEKGKYNDNCCSIHSIMCENMKAMKELNAKRMIPVHHSKFALAAHSWYEPLAKIAELNTENLRLIYPKIGENIDWKDDAKVYEKWWEKYD